MGQSRTSTASCHGTEGRQNTCFKIPRLRAEAFEVPEFEGTQCEQDMEVNEVGRGLLTSHFYQRRRELLECRGTPAAHGGIINVCESKQTPSPSLFGRRSFRLLRLRPTLQLPQALDLLEDQLEACPYALSRQDVSEPLDPLWQTAQSRFAPDVCRVSGPAHAGSCNRTRRGVPR